jgi:hypothetical protein
MKNRFCEGDDDALPNVRPSSKSFRALRAIISYENSSTKDERWGVDDVLTIIFVSERARRANEKIAAAAEFRTGEERDRRLQKYSK